MTDQDTREQLEAEAQTTANAIYLMAYDDGAVQSGRDVEPVRVGTQWITELLDRQAAITERECGVAAWKANYRHMMRQRDELQSKVDELTAERDVLEIKLDTLQAQLDAYDETHMPLPKGSDGEPIHVGDWMERTEFSATMPEVARCIAVTKKEVLCKGKNKVGDAPSMVIKKTKASYWKRCNVNADGEVIRKGEFVWGKDGKKWLVTGFRWGHSYPVCVEDEYGHTKQLKAKWCSHTCPDSLKRIADELREIGADTYRHSGTADLDVIADRIERLM